VRTSLDAKELGDYVAHQLTAFFPDVRVAPEHLARALAFSLDRAEHCFSRIRLKYFDDAGEAVFDHLHTDQYAMVLYLLSHSLFRLDKNRSLASKVYALNKALHGLDVFYEVELPDVFAFQHPVGTVLGRARYGNYFFVYQRCTVGANIDDVYPTLGEGVVMFSGSAVIGDCTVGSNCWVSTDTVIMDVDVPSNSVVFGRPPQLVVKPTTRDVRRDMFEMRR
jgi:serine O-acetyltransferase